MADRPPLVRFVFPCATWAKQRPYFVLALCVVLLLSAITVVAFVIFASTPNVAYVISSSEGWSNEDWDGALAKCASEGYTLASLYSADDARLLKAAALSANQNVWVGATDLNEEGVWL